MSGQAAARCALIGAGVGVVWVLARFEAVPDSVILAACFLLVIVPLIAMTLRRS